MEKTVGIRKPEAIDIKCAPMTMKAKPAPVGIVQFNLDYVGIGDFVVETVPSRSWQVPHFHFIVYKAEEGYFSTNLELALDGYGGSVDDAVTSIIRLSLNYLNDYVRGNNVFGELMKAIRDHLMSDLLRQYHSIEGNLP